MNNPGISERIKTVKQRIEKLIEEGHLDEAKTVLEKFDSKMPGDPDICSMMAVIHIIEGTLDKAEAILLEGLKKDSVQFDLIFNLAYIREQKGQYQEALELYAKAGTVAFKDMQKQNVNEAVNRLKKIDRSLEIKDKAKIVFFVKEGMDNFLGDIINGLSGEYWVRKIIVSDLKQVDAGMEWADVCWFEWCDELVIYGSRLPLAQKVKIICRLHSYEAFTEYIQHVNWENIDKVIFVAEHIRDFVIDKQQNLKQGQTVVIPNGIDVRKYSFRNRAPGFNIAYVGYINYKKGLMLLLHTFKALYDRDSRYKLYIAGKFQDYRDELYFSQMIKEFGIENNIFFEGWQDNIDQWLEDKNYILCTSILESQNLSVMEAMCKGIKPVIHNFVGARGIYPANYIWNTIEEAVDMVNAGNYKSEEYREFIATGFSLERQLIKIKDILAELLQFRLVLKKVQDILNGAREPDDLMQDNLTVLIPCYNRAKMLKDDLDRGLKLGNQPKLIVDDCSTKDIEFLDKIAESFRFESIKSVIIRNKKNSGVAESRRYGLEIIKTKYTAFIDDDNIMICVNRDLAARDISQLEKEVSIIVPRYIINYYGERLSLGYDRQRYDGMNGGQVLKDLAFTGEMMGLLTGGAIGETEWMAGCSYCPLFRVSEDFVMLSRMMASRPEMKVKTTEGLIFVRRFLDEGSTLNPNPLKLMLSLFSQAIACYYCLKLEIANKEEVLKWMKDRAALIQRLYDFGESFETELIAYLTGEISEEIFIQFIALHGLKLKNGLDHLAPELRKMREMLYIYNEPEHQNLFVDVKNLPLVSIIIPTFNRRDMLKRAIDQALKQDYPNIEVIVADNCSEDGTDEMIRINYKNEKRLVYHRNKTNIGPILNYQRAFYSLAKGKYCLFLSDDDYLIDPSYISKAIKTLEGNNDIAFVFSGYYYNHEVKQKVYRILPDYPPVIDGLDFFINFTRQKYVYMPNLCTTLFRIDNALNMDILKGNPNCLAGDLSVFLRLLLSGNAAYINSIALVYTLHKGSISLNPENAVINNQHSVDRVVESAVQDINEMVNISKLAVRLKQIDNATMKNWLDFRIWKYMYWRFNETVQSVEECRALIKYMLKEYPDLMQSLKDVAIKRFGEKVMDVNIK